MSTAMKQPFSFAPWLQIVLAALGAVGVLLTVLALVLTIRWTPRRGNEPPRRGRPLRIIRFWRPSHYSLALGNLQDYCNRLSEGRFCSGADAGRVSQYDLVRWILQLSLTCAAAMIPHSLGKANLFRISETSHDLQGRATRVTVYSSEFVGVFSANQLIDTLNPTYIRKLELRMDEISNQRAYPAALQCVAEKMPIIQSLGRRRATFDEPERSLGATHILAIPLIFDLERSALADTPVSITVDLHFGRVSGWLVDHRDMQKTSLFRRADQLAKIIGAEPDLLDPKYLPRTDRPIRLPNQTPRPSSEVAHVDERGGSSGPN